MAESSVIENNNESDEENMSEDEETTEEILASLLDEPEGREVEGAAVSKKISKAVGLDATIDKVNEILDSIAIGKVNDILDSIALLFPRPPEESEVVPVYEILNSFRESYSLHNNGGIQNATQEVINQTLKNTGIQDQMNAILTEVRVIGNDSKRFLWWATFAIQIVIIISILAFSTFVYWLIF